MTSISFQKLSQADIDYYSRNNEKCLFCERALVTAPTQTSTSRLSALFNTLNPFVLEPDQAPYGHERGVHDTSNPQIPKLVDCYHKSCLKNAAMYASVANTDICCIRCLLNIGNIGEFLSSKRERALDTIKLILMADRIEFNTYEKMLNVSKWPGSRYFNFKSVNVRAEIAAIVTAVLTGAFTGGVSSAFVRAVRISQQEEISSQDAMTSIFCDAMNGAMAGAVTATCTLLSARNTALVLSPVPALVGGKHYSAGAVLAASSARSIFTSIGVSVGSSLHAQNPTILMNLLSGTAIGTVAVSLPLILGAPSQDERELFMRGLGIKKTDPQTLAYTCILADNDDVIDEDVQIERFLEETGRSMYVRDRSATISENWIND